ncbi:MAG: flagellar export protein FliJ [Candidatus Auribacterota bacterium]
MPKKFVFKLETVLHYRQVIEDKKKRDFSQALSTLENEKRKLQDIDKKIADKIAELAHLEQNCHTAVDFFNYQVFVTHLEQARKKQILVIEKAQAVLAQKRMEYIEATKNTKVLLRLKEKAMADYLKEMSFLEQKFLDELATLRAARTHAV